MLTHESHHGEIHWGMSTLIVLLFEVWSIFPMVHIYLSISVEKRNLVDIQQELYQRKFETEVTEEIEKSQILKKHSLPISRLVRN